MNLQIPVEKAGPRTAAAELLDGFDGGFLHPGMIGEPEIVVGSGHDQSLSIHHYLGVLRRFDLSEEEVVTAPLNLQVFLMDLQTLLKDVHLSPHSVL